jgi:hypothetical protein
VIDALGQPLRDRDLQLSPLPAPDPGEFFIPRFPGHSDGEGRLEVPLGRPLPRNSPYAFRIDDPATGEFGWSQLDHGMSNAIIDIGDVVVEPASEKFPVLMDGWVRSTAGDPVPGLTGTVGTASMFQLSPSASGPPRDTRDRWYGHLEFLPSGEFRLYGDPRAQSVRLEIQAPGFIPYLAQELVVPSHGLEIELTQTVQWSGRLKLPTPGPGAGEYNLRIGSGTQLIPGTVSESGEFSISGPSDSERLDVLYGQLGTPLLSIPLTAQAPGDYSLGTLDLTEKICAFDFELLDAAGQPWPRAPIVISFAGGIQPLATDESGRLRGAVAASEEWIELFGGHPDRLRIDPRHPPVPVVLSRP